MTELLRWPNEFVITTFRGRAISFSPVVIIFLLAIIANALLAGVMPRGEGWEASGGDGEAAQIAAAIARGQGFSSPFIQSTGPSAWIPPVYPYLLAAIYRVFGVFAATSHWVAIAVNIVVHALTCILLYRIASQAFSLRIGWYSACALASFPLLFYPLVALHVVIYGGVREGPLGLFISPYIIWYTHLSEFAILLLIWLTLNPPHWIVFGTAWGVVSLLNPTVLILAPAFMGWRLWRRSGWRYIVLTVAVTAICLAPWLVRNYLVFHHLVFIRDNFGVELRVGNQPGSRGLLSGSVHPNGSAKELTHLAQTGEAEYTRIAGQEALQSIRAHPGEFVRNTIFRVWWWWIGTPMISPRLASMLGNLKFVLLVRYLPALTFSLLTLLGVLCTLKGKEGKALLFVAVVLFYPLVYYVTHTASGFIYQYPIQPEMLALAIFAVCQRRAVFELILGPLKAGWAAISAAR